MLMACSYWPGFECTCRRPICRTNPIQTDLNYILRFVLTRSRYLCMRFRKSSTSWQQSTLREFTCPNCMSNVCPSFSSSSQQIILFRIQDQTYLSVYSELTWNSCLHFSLLFDTVSIVSQRTLQYLGALRVITKVGSQKGQTNSILPRNMNQIRLVLDVHTKNPSHLYDLSHVPMAFGIRHPWWTCQWRLMSDESKRKALSTVSTNGNSPEAWWTRVSARTDGQHIRKFKTSTASSCLKHPASASQVKMLDRRNSILQIFIA